ncbi:hypothetical protein [Chitinophaga qingshengii]|uniref:Uncharacterized protein n=1 Tax=Chitinophaga qingshengii TaxID=1569794 RepID=A0ABR7TJ02_9BACT|nr:hypothetical protein [Chitinophaga qingshengii]MBC9930486.1 hypothetical protein [Chitinophaga qingshengii]
MKEMKKTRSGWATTGYRWTLVPLLLISLVLLYSGTAPDKMSITTRAIVMIINAVTAGLAQAIVSLF